MPQLPTGTVTFLFTDIEGSTELVRGVGERYAAVLERHHAILRDASARNAGIVVSTEGDAFFIVFNDARRALDAAVEAQHALHAEAWPDGATVRVRMGLHTGQGTLGGDNYTGLDVHRAARIAAAGYGGQVLLSDATRALVEPGLADGLATRDLGRHSLKGLAGPERIYQLLIPGLPANFPPIRSPEARPNNLPRMLTSFIGREREIAEIRERLHSTRLLTLTGPGGTGKTRLAIRVAEDALGEYEDGCWFVSLDALRDAALVPATIADALAVKVAPDQAPLAAVADGLAGRELLLVLDNFEQVADAATDVAQLLDAAPRLRVVVTSRVPLGLYGEQEYPVPSLGGAAELRRAGSSGAETLSQYEAVRLFIERAVAVKPDFRVTNENAPALAELCARLDGLPLAIELAAARIKLLAPEHMLKRLEQSLSILATTAANLPARQRTLQGAIDWSYDLLDEPERTLFSRLSAFRGGFSLESAEAVVNAEDVTVDVLEGVESLVNKSLLRALEQEPETRLAMLETIREYARQRLRQSPDEQAVLRRHARRFFVLAVSAEQRLMGPEQLEWLDRLERDHDNLRAAYDRAIELGLLDEALEAAGAMWRFWQLRAHFVEGRSVLERLLAEPGASAGARASALTALGGITYWQGDFGAMSRHYREASELFAQVGDRQRLAEAVLNEGYAPLLQGRRAEARPFFERAAQLYHEVGNHVGGAEAEWMAGFSYFIEGQPEKALPIGERVIEAYRQAGAAWNVADTLLGLGHVQASLGKWPDAVASIREALGLFRELGSDLGLAMTFEAVAIAAAGVGDAEQSALLFGKVARMRGELGGGAPTDLFFVAAYRELARQRLEPAAFDRLLATGERLSTDEAVRLVEAFEPPADAGPLPRAGRPSGPRAME